MASKWLLWLILKFGQFLLEKVDRGDWARIKIGKYRQVVGHKTAKRERFKSLKSRVATLGADDGVSISHLI